MNNNEELRNSLNKHIDNLTDKQLKEVNGGVGEPDYRDYYSCPKCRSNLAIEVKHSQRDGWILNKCGSCGHQWTVLANQIIW